MDMNIEETHQNVNKIYSNNYWNRNNTVQKSNPVNINIIENFILIWWS